MQVAPLASDAVHGDADPAEMAPASPTKAKHNPSDRVPRNSSTGVDLAVCSSVSVICTITTPMPPRRRKKGLRKKAHPEKIPKEKGKNERRAIRGNEKKKEREER